MNKKTQTYDEMIMTGATPDEAKKALELFELLFPSLKIKSNGWVYTTLGYKTPLGLYRAIGSRIFS